MPGMIDTHRHMWQTAMRGYGADWTLTQYFVWYYLEYGRVFRPEDVYAGNLLASIEAVDAGVTTVVDWSHGLQTVGHAEAAVDALRTGPGRNVLAYGNIQQPPAEWTTDPAFRAFAEPDGRRRHAGLPAGLRRDRRPGLPREARVRGGPRARRPGLDARRRVGRDRRRRHPAHARARIHDARDRVRTCRHPVGGLLPAHSRHRRIGLGVHRERAERRPGLPSDLGPAHARHPGVAVHGHQRLVERRPVLGDARHARRRPLPRAPSRRTRSARPSRTPRCAASTLSPGPRAAARTRSGAGATSAAWSRGRRPTSC